MKKIPWLALVLVAFSCNKDDTEETDTDTDTDTDADFDPTEGLSYHTECDCSPTYCYDWTAASRNFVGVFDFVGEDEVEGYEWWVIFPNDTLKATADWTDIDDHCLVTWEVEGTKGDASENCTGCQYSIAIDAEIVSAETNCPAGVYAGEETFSVTYDVNVSGGTSSFYFATSGNLLGEGDGDDNRISYVTEWTCVAF